MVAQVGDRVVIISFTVAIVNGQILFDGKAAAVHREYAGILLLNALFVSQRPNSTGHDNDCDGADDDAGDGDPHRSLAELACS